MSNNQDCMRRAAPPGAGVPCPGGCASTRVSYQQNTSPLYGVATIPARGHIIATCGPYSPKAAPSPRLSSHPPLQSVRREIQKLLCTNFLAPGYLFAG